MQMNYRTKKKLNLPTELYSSLHDKQKIKKKSKGEEVWNNQPCKHVVGAFTFHLKAFFQKQYWGDMTADVQFSSRERGLCCRKLCLDVSEMQTAQSWAPRGLPALQQTWVFKPKSDPSDITKTFF